MEEARKIRIKKTEIQEEKEKKHKFMEKLRDKARRPTELLGGGKGKKGKAKKLMEVLKSNSPDIRQYLVGTTKKDKEKDQVTDRQWNPERKSGCSYT